MRYSSIFIISIFYGIFNFSSIASFEESYSILDETFDVAGVSKAVNVLSSGKILVATATGAATELMQLTSTYDIDTTSFGSGTGKINLTGFLDPKNIMVDTAGDIYIVGTNGSGVSLLAKVSLNGSNILWMVSNNELLIGQAVHEQASGRIVLSGSNSAGGILVGYNPIDGSLDSCFGLSGYHATGFISQIADHAITNNDAILFTYLDTNNRAIVQRLLLDGSSLDSSFTFGTALTSVVAADQIRMQIDVHNKIVVIANNGSGFIARRYTENGANDVGPLIISLTNPSTATLENIICLSDGTTLILGSNSNGNSCIIARLNSSFALDTTFNTTGLLQENISSMTQFHALDITIDGNIIVAGGTSIAPYLTSVADNQFVTKVNQNTTSLGVPGKIDINFGDLGQVFLASFILANASAQALLPTSSGCQYVAFDNGNLIRLTNEVLLDMNFNSTGFASNSPKNVFSMILDGLNRLVLAGTSGNAGWITRYVSGNTGSLDTTFHTIGLLNFESATVATAIVEQSMSRLVVAGQNSHGYGMLRGFTNAGIVDNSFGISGEYETTACSTIYTLVADRYDRLLFAYKNGSSIDIARLTSSGSVDTRFGSNGIISDAIVHADSESQVQLVLNSDENLVVAAHINDGANKIAIKEYSNMTGILVTEIELDLTTLADPVLTNLIATSDGNVLLSGYQSGINGMWVAKIIDDISSGAYILDTTFGTSGIMIFLFDTSATTHILNAIAIYANGEICMIGHESNPGNNSFVARAYNNPYTTQVAKCLDAQVIGTNDITFGSSISTTTDLGISFFACSDANAASEQAAQAIALQDDNSILVAVDGGASADSSVPTDIFLQVFNIDGLPNTNFGINGQQPVLNFYENQFVNDMISFHTVDGVCKAILAGYVSSVTLGSTNSLLLQYNLSTLSLDDSFGAYDGDPAGIALGRGKKNNSVGLQSTGRIITAGSTQDNIGLLTGYTSHGKIDTSFGLSGYVEQIEATELFTHVIDTQNRVVIAYKNISNNVVVARYLVDGSGLDTSFGSGGMVTTSISVGVLDDNFIRIAIDGANNIAVAATDGATTLTINSFSAANGTTGVAFTPAISLTKFVLAKLLIDVDEKAIIVGYDAVSTGPQQIVIVRINSSLSGLDTTFNPEGPIPGCLKYAVGSGAHQVATDALIHPDGRILVVGSQA